MNIKIPLILPALLLLVAPLAADDAIPHLRRQEAATQLIAGMTRLTHALSPVTAFSLAACKDGIEVEKTVKVYRRVAIFLACLIIPMSLATFVTTSISEAAQKDIAEANALAETCAHADLHDGQDILELGCGWGSLSLWMAAQYPQARITAVSNSNSQRQYIMDTARARGLGNLRVITADMNAFTTEARFDRVVSVEMFEHMANWDALLGRVRDWLRPDGRLFLHVFTHVSAPYRFDTADPADWIARHFFTGGIMPSHNLAHSFPHLFQVEQDWRWDGRHYQRTARHWLENFDANAARIDVLLQGVYGAQAGLWRRRWRLFFLAVEGLFGHEDGSAWGVSHYRLEPVS